MFKNKFSNRLRGCWPGLAVVVVATLLSACSGGSGGGQRSENTPPRLQLSDGQVIIGGNTVIRIPASDDTGITNVLSRLLRQGDLQECRVELSERGHQIANSLLDACLADQPSCAVDFLPTAGEIAVFPPPLFAPVGLEYELSLVDRDGTTADPITAVFCFDVGPNAAPQPAADTYQLIYPSVIQRRGVSYNNRCEKQDGSDGVLVNDDDDEHTGNTCLTAELLDLPDFAANPDTFRSSFRPDGGFRYEGIGDVPPSDADGVTRDSFTYRVSDGVNPPSAPVTVTIVFSGENAPPVLIDDQFTIVEDAPAQSFSVLVNDTDPDALPLSITRISDGPTNGVANIRNGVLIEYQPNTDFNGRDQFRYTVLDSGGLSVTALVEITVTGVNDAPQAVNDNAFTDENVPVVVSVLTNDTDIEGDSLSVSSVSSPVNGAVSINGDGTITYTPATNFSGVDPFEYTITDGNSGTDTATVVVQVALVNSAPEAVADNLALDEGNSATVNVLANDLDNDGDPLSIESVSEAANGVVEILSSSEVRYTPNEEFTGSDSFTYVVSDGIAESLGRVAVIVSAVNDPPNAVNDAVTTSENTAISIDVLGNDSDPDGDQLSISITRAPVNGTAVVGSDETVLYTPDTDFDGTDSFRYQVTDAAGETAVATVIVTINNVNASPVAVNDSASTNEGAAVSIDVLDNDSDPDGNQLTLSVTVAPSNGAAVVVDGLVRYTPAVDFSGTDQFTYQIADTAGATDTANVTVLVSNVNTAPVAVDDVITTEVDDPVSIAVLDNDIDADNDTLSIVDTNQPENGTARIRGRSIIYAPAAGFSGDDSFRYQITDGNDGTATGTVTITVISVNSAPVALDDIATTLENAPVNVDVLNNDTDADSDSLTVALSTPPENGTAVVESNVIVYTPADDFTGIDTLVYEVNDGNSGTDTATVTITVSRGNQAPIAGNDVASTQEDTAVTINVLDNDSDADGDNLTVAVDAGAPANGSARLTVDQQIEYTPGTSFVGTDSFTYEITDGAGGAATATVTVVVVSGNSAPIAGDDAAATTIETPVTISVLDNDTDPDNDSLTVTVTVVPENGAAVVNADGSVIYTPAESFTGTDTFEYSIDDGAGGTATATVTIEVAAVNVPPVAADDLASTQINDLISIDVLGNDTDADGDLLAVTVVVQPPAGSASVVTEGRIVYTPAADFIGDETFSYQVDDGNGGTDTASVTVSVLNTPPVALADAATTSTATAIEIDVLDNDTDADLHSLTVSSVTTPGNGSAVVLASNLILYTSEVDFAGSDSFEYTIDDGNGGTASAEVTVTVTTGNTVPVAVADNVVADTAALVNIDVLANDSDDDGDTLTVTIVTPPLGGTAVVQANNTVDYTSSSEFIGTDAFEYSIDDANGGTSSAVVTIVVGEVLASR
ncbi:hypothetical protein AB833_29690 [Chromatiales bacterium (ex Bugula neritina AB1)]|nr:hypothetical protein AB833_29690 [Chromatiales bacterium (ex Bugula neritina AB1)]